MYRGKNHDFLQNHVSPYLMRRIVNANIYDSGKNCFSFFFYNELRQTYHYMMSLSGVSEHGGTITDQEEVDGNAHNHKVCGVVGVHTSSEGLEGEVELTSTRDINMTAGLVRTWVEVKGNHVHTTVIRSLNMLTSIGVWNVVVEEACWDVAV